jgi:hypothetical protein
VPRPSSTSGSISASASASASGGRSHSVPGPGPDNERMYDHQHPPTSGTGNRTNPDAPVRSSTYMRHSSPDEYGAAVHATHSFHHRRPSSLSLDGALERERRDGEPRKNVNHDLLPPRAVSEPPTGTGISFAEAAAGATVGGARDDHHAVRSAPPFRVIHPARSHGLHSPTSTSGSPAATPIPLIPDAHSPSSRQLSFSSTSPRSHSQSHALAESRRRNAEQRAATLRADELIKEVQPNKVFCGLCFKWVQLRQDSTYCAYPWLQHRAKCVARQ